MSNRTIPADHPAILAARAKGLLPADAKSAKGKPVVLVEPGRISRWAWLVAYEAVNESNQRSWKARNRRAGMAWQAVRRAVSAAQLAPFEEALWKGTPLRATFTRLGGKRLDAMVNLPASMKGVEDAFAYLLGIDDGSPLWVPSCTQEPGPLVGVRVRLEVLGSDKE